MTAPRFSPRLLAALGIIASEINTTSHQHCADVDHTDRRFRDAIKAGATPVVPPATQSDYRTATLADPTTNTTLTIRSPLPDRG